MFMVPKALSRCRNSLMKITYLTCCSKSFVLDGNLGKAMVNSLAENVSTDPARRPCHETQDRLPIKDSKMKWFLDWDGTMTTADTLSVVASIGYDKNSSRNIPTWSQLSEAYTVEYKVHASRHKPDVKNSISLEQFLAWQESLVDVERASVERVERAGVFSNVTEEDVDNAARQAIQKSKVVLRPGLGSLLDQVRAGGSCITVISVNWSRRFIDACLRCLAELEHNRPYRNITIRANEIEFGWSTKLSRTFAKEDRGIWTANDKAKIMQEELKASSEQHTTIYVGDSLTDLPCLLLADVGICIKDEKLSSEQQSLQEILTTLTIPCHWIGDFNTHTNRDCLKGYRMWWARDFDDICNSALFREYLE